jgi:hypothetical protein
MEEEYIFELRCYYRVHSSCPIECYRETVAANGFSYDECLEAARKEFRRRNTNCRDVPNEMIEVLTSEKP